MSAVGSSIDRNIGARANLFKHEGSKTRRRSTMSSGDRPMLYVLTRACARGGSVVWEARREGTQTVGRDLAGTPWRACWRLARRFERNLTREAHRFKQAGSRKPILPTIEVAHGTDALCTGACARARVRDLGGAHGPGSAPRSKRKGGIPGTHLARTRLNKGLALKAAVGVTAPISSTDRLTRRGKTGETLLSPRARTTCVCRV